MTGNKAVHKRSAAAVARMIFVTVLILTLLFSALSARAEETDGSSPAAAQEIDITTPKKGIAVAAPEKNTDTVPLFEDASEDSAILMEYYSGARFEVVGFSAGGDMARVQCGVKGASIMGYIRVGDLRYGAYAERMVPQCAIIFMLDADVSVYSYPDEQATLLQTLPEGYRFCTVSRSDSGWAQWYDPKSADMLIGEWTDDETAGFVHLRMSPNEASFEQDASWYVDPIESELSYEEAYERAMALALDNPDILDSVGVTAEDVPGMRAQIDLIYNSVNQTSFWRVFFDNFDISERTFEVKMEPDGTLIGFELGVG